MSTLMGPGGIGVPMFGTQAATKTEQGYAFPRAAFAYVPSELPRTWGVRLWETPQRKETSRQLEAAVASLKTVPAPDLPVVIRRVVQAWQALNAGELPAALRKEVDGVAPPGWEQSLKRMKKDRGIDNPWALCLTGETVIPCLDGIARTAQELAESGQSHWLYAIDPEQFLVVPGLAHVRYVGIKRVIAISLDNGETLRCSPEHRWMLRDGAFLESRLLQAGMSLMPFRAKDEKSTKRRVAGEINHECVYHPGLATYSLTHWAVMRAIAPQSASGGYLIHHKNENPRDNRPENLQWVTRHEHAIIHGTSRAKDMQRGFKHALDTNEGFALAHIQRGREAARKLWDDPAYQEKMLPLLRAQAKEAGQRAADIHRARKRAQQEEDFRDQMPFDLASENHLIEAVVFTDELAPMYDVAVEGYHTFAVSAGVFSHNSWWLKNRGAKPSRHEADMSASADDTSLLKSLVRQQRFLPPICIAAARGEAWAQAQLLSESYPPLVVEGRW